MITESSEVPRFCGISGAHRAYPAAGGLGILVGERQLPHPGVESIVESYYRSAGGEIEPGEGPRGEALKQLRPPTWVRGQRQTFVVKIPTFFPLATGS